MMWTSWNLQSILVGIRNGGAAILENGLAVPQNGKHGITINSTSHYIPKRTENKLYMDVYISNSHNSPNAEESKCLSTYD